MEFSCPACGSPAVVYPDHLTEDAPVKCRRCATVLCTLREFRSSAIDGAGRFARRGIGSGSRLLGRVRALGAGLRAPARAAPDD